MPISRMGADDEGMVDLAELLGKFIVRRVRGTGDGSDKLTRLSIVQILAVVQTV